MVKVGDVVTIRKDLSVWGRLGGFTILREIAKIAGKTVTVREVSPRGTGSFKVDGCYYWINESFITAKNTEGEVSHGRN